MVESIYVKPHPDFVKESRVALWDQHDPENPIHSQVDPVWDVHGGAYIAGNPQQPDAHYKVANTIAVGQAIRDGRLIKLEESEVSDPNGSVAKPPPPVPTQDQVQVLEQEVAELKQMVASLMSGQSNKPSGKKTAKVEDEPNG